MPTHIGEGDVIYSVYPFRFYSLLETPSQTHAPPSDVLPDIGASLSPAKVTRKITHHSDITNIMSVGFLKLLNRKCLEISLQSQI